MGKSFSRSLWKSVVLKGYGKVLYSVAMEKSFTHMLWESLVLEGYEKVFLKGYGKVLYSKAMEKSCIQRLWKSLLRRCYGKVLELQILDTVPTVKRLIPWPSYRDDLKVSTFKL